MTRDLDENEILKSLKDALKDHDNWKRHIDSYIIVSNMKNRTQEINDNYCILLSMIGKHFEGGYDKPIPRDELDKYHQGKGAYKIDMIPFFAAEPPHWYGEMYEVATKLDHKDFRTMALLNQAQFYAQIEDIAELARVCELRDSAGLDHDESVETLWNAWKAIVDSYDGDYPTSSDSSSNCFIATAAYGTPFDPKIDVLRTWRDDSLQKSILGRSFIKFYYSISPPIANIISMSIFLRWLVRISISPIIILLKRKYN